MFANYDVVLPQFHLHLHNHLGFLHHYCFRRHSFHHCSWFSLLSGWRSMLVTRGRHGCTVSITNPLSSSDSSLNPTVCQAVVSFVSGPGSYFGGARGSKHLSL